MKKLPKRVIAAFAAIIYLLAGCTPTPQGQTETTNNEATVNEDTVVGETKDLWVLFPLSREARKITVDVGMDGHIYEGDIIIDSTLIITDTSGNGPRKIDQSLKLKKTTE